MPIIPTFPDNQPHIRQRLAALLASWDHDLLGRGPQLEMLLIVAMAREPILWVGPPGVGKSATLHRLAQALGYDPHLVFEYVLSNDTRPAELLATDRSLRPENSRERANLLTAPWVHLQEVFQANSAVLNLLLDWLDRPNHIRSGGPSHGTHQVLIGSVYDLTESSHLAGLRDRFAIKMELEPTSSASFTTFLRAALAAEWPSDGGSQGNLDRPGPREEAPRTGDPPVEDAEQLAPADLQAAQRAFAEHLRLFPTPDETRTPRDAPCPGLPPDVASAFQHLLKTLIREDRLFVSDRKIYKLYKLMRARAWLRADGMIRIDDLILLSYVGETREEIALLRDKVPVMLTRL